MHITAPLAVMAVIGLGNLTQAGFIYWDPATGGNGHYYDFVLPAENPSWHQAYDAAAASVHLGMVGHLLTVNSLAEHNFIRLNWVDGFTSTGSANATWSWIGLSDDRTEGNFEWITGEAVTFTAWHSGQPNNETFVGAAGEDYAHYWLAVDDMSFSWNDSVSPAFNAANGLQLGYFVEYEVRAVPEPSSSVLLAVVFVSFAISKRRRILSRMP